MCIIYLVIRKKIKTTLTMFMMFDIYTYYLSYIIYKPKLYRYSLIALRTSFIMLTYNT